MFLGFFFLAVWNNRASANRSDFPPPHVTVLLQAWLCGTVPLSSCQAGGHFELLQETVAQNVCRGRGTSLNYGGKEMENSYVIQDAHV